MSDPAWVSGQSLGGTVGTSANFTNNSNGFSAGNCLVLALACWWDSGSPGQPTVTDNHGNTYTWLAGGARLAADGTRADIFVSPPLAAAYSTGTYTATAVANSANLTGTNELYGQLTEWSGFGPLGIALDVSGFSTSGVGASSASVTLSSGTSKQAVEAIVCIIHFNDDTNPDGIAANPGGTGTWTHGGSITDAFNNLAVGTSSQVTSATGTAYTATWSGLNTSTNNGGEALIVALYPAPSTAGQVQWPTSQRLGPGVSPNRLNQFVTRPSWAVPVVQYASLTGQSIASATGTFALSSKPVLTGIVATSGAGALGITLSATVAGQSSITATGLNAESAAIALTGQASTFAAGTVLGSSPADVTLTVNGQPATFGQGLILGPADVIRDLSGLASASALGAIVFGNGPAITGQVLASNAGVLGNSGFGIPVVGQLSPSASGALTWSASLPLTAQVGALTAGTPVASPTFPLSGSGATATPGGLSIAGFGAGTTWDSGIISWDSSFQTWDGGTSASVQSPFGQVKQPGPGISPDYNRLFQPMRGATSAPPQTVAVSLAGARLTAAQGSIFAQINTTLTLNLVGQRAVLTPGQIVISSNITVALNGTSMTAVSGAIKYAPIYPVDPEYLVTVGLRPFSVPIDAYQAYVVGISPRSFTVIAD